MKYLNLTYPDLENGLGCRVTLWAAGCSHHCKGCHNSETWDFNQGIDFTEDSYKTLSNTLSKPYIQGITFSGGDPLYKYNIDGLIALCKRIKKDFPNKDIWLYTGYTWEDILKSSTLSEVLKYVDYLVDGPFIQELRDISLAFRGSSNQRIIDVQQSLNNDKLIIWKS